MSLTASLIPELEMEAATTKRVLERLPAAKLAWRPHEKAMSLGQLALHTAQVPAMAAGLLAQDLDGVPPFEQAEAATIDEVLEAHEASVAAAKQALAETDDATALADWTLREDGQVLMAVPRIAMIRQVMLNHWYHHRGQLTTYLRVLGESVPAVYGRSADESLFEMARQAQPA